MMAILVGPLFEAHIAQGFTTTEFGKSDISGLYALREKPRVGGAGQLRRKGTKGTPGQKERFVVLPLQVCVINGVGCPVEAEDVPVTIHEGNFIVLNRQLPMVVQHRAGGEHYLRRLYTGFTMLTAEPAEVASLNSRYRIVMDFAIDNGTGNLPGTKAKAPEKFARIGTGTAAAAIFGSEKELLMRIFRLHY